MRGYSMSKVNQMHRVELSGPKVYHLPNWADGDDNDRMDVITDIIMRYGRDPKIATKAVEILKKYDIKPRDYVGQAAALLKWVQDDIYYVNEPGERLQDPNYTLKVGYGDCDDMAIVLCSFFESMRLPWKLVISGRAANGKTLRYIHRQGKLPKADWAHIYCMVGAGPFGGGKWYYCEPTIRGVPLGWDVVAAGDQSLPELMKPDASAFGAPRANAIIGGALAAETSLTQSQLPSREGGYRKILNDTILAIIVGVATSVLSEVLLESIQRARGK